MQTSYFSKYKEPDGISIAGKAPDFYKGETFKELAPKYWFFQEYKKNHNTFFYTYYYQKEVLDKLDPVKIYEKLKNRTLLCFEKSGDFCHRRLVAKWLEANLNVKIPEVVDGTNLECSSTGDRRMSAFYAKVNFLFSQGTIEDFYQGAKRFNGEQLSTKEAKGETPTSFVILKKEYSVEQLSMFYDYLWTLYFVQNPHYLDYINQFETFTDKFKGSSVNCQADTIQKIKDNGLGKIITNVLPFVLEYGLG